MSGLGDIDLDGYPDVLVGAYSGANADTVPSYVNCYSGHTGLRIRNHPQEFKGFGQSVARAGDTDADGIPDYLIAGTPFNTPVPGKALLFSGFRGPRFTPGAKG